MEHPLVSLFLVVLSLRIFTLVYAQNHTELPPSALFNPPPNANVSTIHILDERGERNIAYYVSNGFAIVDGDIAYGTVDELLARVVPPNGTVIGRRSVPRRHLDSRAHSIFPNGAKWPGAHVMYKYESDATKTKVSPYINEGILRWQNKNPFLQFTEVSAPTTNVVAGVVTITAAECGGCYASVIGYTTSTQFGGLVLNLQQSCGSDSSGCFYNEATHEIGHVLGLVHEVKRPDRDTHVNFMCKNLVDYPSYLNPVTCCTSSSTCCGWACQFTIDNSYDHSLSYAVTSIMQYRADSFAAPGLLTLVGIPPDVVPAFNPSMPDINDYERICKIYFEECKGVCGNGIVEPANGEVCDDGNDNNFDSCSNYCQKLSVCGNGVLETGEQCDDGNTVSGDGCSSTCMLEAGVCGNGIVELGEECDDGNLLSGDGCSSTCKKETLCIACNPIPGLNHCDITTSCITIEPSGQRQCACRAGYRANALGSQIAMQWRLPFPGQEYRVFVAPGVPCDTLCNQPYGAPSDICNEVKVVNQCDP